MEVPILRRTEILKN